MMNPIEFETSLSFYDEKSSQIVVNEPNASVILNFTHSVGKLEVEFFFDLYNNKFCAMFWKDGSLFTSQGDVFEARTWKGLRDKIEFKMRDADFVYFVGVLNRHKIAKVLDKAEKELKAIEKKDLKKTGN